MNGAMAANIAPTPLSRRQAVSPTRPPGPADAGELARDALVVGREDDADRRGDDVEGRVRVVEVLAVGHLEREVEAVLLCPALRGLDERRREVGAGHDRTRARRMERDVARSAGEVEPVLAGRGREALDERQVHVADEVRDVLERGRAPHHGVTARELFECHASPPVDR